MIQLYEIRPVTRRSVHGFGGAGCLPFLASARRPGGRPMFSSSVLAVTHHPQVRRLVPRTPPPVASSAGSSPATTSTTAMDPDPRAGRPRPARSPSTTSAKTSPTPPTPSATREAYVALLDRLDDLGLAHAVEVSVKLSARRPGPARRRRADRARPRRAPICAAAARAGTTVTLDMEDHTTVDSTLEILATLRREHPWVGAVLQSALRRTEADAADLARAGSRVRLVKGAYAEPASVAYTGEGRGRRGLPALPAHPDGRPGLSDGRHPRPRA